MMYDDEREALGPPSAERRQFIESEIGRARFVSDLCLVTHTKYKKEALYALGWFGDDHHLDCLVDGLNDKDPEVRRIALSSLSRLAGVKFADIEEAEQWWETQCSTQAPQ